MARGKQSAAAVDSPVRVWVDPVQARHETKMALSQMDPDDPEPLAGHSMRSGSKPPRVEHTKGKLERTARGRPKVWKAQFWKRRKLDRRRRAAYAAAVARGDA